MKRKRFIYFGEIVEVSKESVDRQNNPYERYVEGGHMDSNCLKLNRWGKFGDDYVGPAFHRLFRKGQILYGSRRTYLKKVAVADFDGVTANTTFVLSPKSNSPIHPEIIPFLMLSSSFTQHSILNSKGSTNPYINWSDIAKFRVKHIENQDEKLQTLKAAELAVIRAEEALNKCEELQLSILKETFTPKANWISYRLLEICQVKGGRQRAPKYELGHNPVKYLRPANIKKGKFRFEDIKEMDFTESELNEFLLKEGDILLVEGGEAEDVGDALYWSGDTEDQFAFQNTLIRLRANASMVPPKTLYWLVVYLHRTGYFLSMAAGTKIKHIGSKNTSQSVVKLPGNAFELQKEVKLLDELDDVIETLEVKITESKKLLQKLIDAYLE